MLLLVVLAAVGCQRIDAAEQSAKKTVAKVAQAPAAVPSVENAHTETTPTGRVENAAPKACGEEGEACGPGCTTPGAVDPTWAPLPAGTPWTALHVTGMKCGECAKKIERALAKVDGVKGVKVDLDTQKVEVAVGKDKDARTLTKPVIDGLGYHVD